MIGEYTILPGQFKALLRIVLLAVAICLTAFLVYGVWRANERELGHSNSSGSIMEAAMQLSNMEYTEMENGRRLWTLRAEKAGYYQEKQKSVLSNVHMIFYLQDGREIRLTSDHGILFVTTKNIDLSGRVQATMPEGYTVRTEKVSYRHKQGSVSSQTPTYLKGPEVTLQGDRWEYRLAEEHGTLHGGVRAIVDLNRLQQGEGA